LEHDYDLVMDALPETGLVAKETQDLGLVRTGWSSPPPSKLRRWSSIPRKSYWNSRSTCWGLGKVALTGLLGLTGYVIALSWGCG
jgi:hypothetical protein